MGNISIIIDKNNKPISFWRLKKRIKKEKIASRIIPVCISFNPNQKHIVVAQLKFKNNEWVLNVNEDVSYIEVLSAISTAYNKREKIESFKNDYNKGTGSKPINKIEPTISFVTA